MFQSEQWVSVAMVQTQFPDAVKFGEMLLGDDWLSWNYPTHLSASGSGYTCTDNGLLSKSYVHEIVIRTETTTTE